MILCVNANAAIDKTVVVPGFHLDAIQRPERVLALGGGKGANCARGLQRLGETPLVMGWAGGFNGGFIEAELRGEGIATAFVPVDAESRTCLSILDPDGGTLTELYERGEPVPEAKVAEFKALFQERVPGCAAVTLSGSLPPGVPPDFYADLIALARAAGVPALLDSSGAALRHGLEQGQPALIKPNAAEFAELCGRPLPTRDDQARAAREMARRWGTIVVVSLGAAGALVAADDAVHRVASPPLAIKSAVGSGDCLLAGLAHGLTHGMPPQDAARYGIAAGTANALTVGAGHFSAADFARVLAQVTVTPYRVAN